MTFDAGDVVRLVLWGFLGALLVSLTLVIALNKSFKPRAIGASIVLTGFASIAGWSYYKIIVRPEQLAKENARSKGVPATAQEHRARYEAAKSLFDERCKTARQTIHKTVENVEGLLLLNVREEFRVANEADPSWPDAGLPNEPGGENYIASFLQWEHHEDKRTARGYLNDRKSDLPGYRYVDAKDSSGTTWRYMLSQPGAPNYPNLSKTSPQGSSPRYAVSFTNLIDLEDRKKWVAGTTATITDTRNSEVLATATWYSFESGLGSTAGSRQPWRRASTCPELRGSVERAPTRFFVDQVLKPKKAE